MKRHTTVIVLLAAACSGLSVAACSGSESDSHQGQGSASEGPTGTVGLGLTLANNVTVNTVSYSVTGPGGFTKTGTFDVSSSSTVSGQVTLPAGGPYTVTLSGTSTDSSTSCMGSSTFSVTAHTTNTVIVHLACREAARTGSVLVSGALNICPVIDGISVSPSEVYVGKTVALDATAHDSDSAPAALGYSWTATTGGSLSSATAQSPTFTCLKPGAVTVTLTLTDGDTTAGCNDTRTAVVTCTNPPYLAPVAANVLTKAIMTVGDSFNNKPDGTPYRMVGIPDGLGAFDNGDGSFTLLMNHEIQGAGIARAHGGTGAFVSKWQIRKSDLAVLNGQDLIQSVTVWNPTTLSYLAPATGNVFARFCSADLAAPSAFFDTASGLGFNGPLFLNGEETGNEGKAWAHGIGGVSWELPRLGKASWENQVANPATGVKTVVAGTDDSTPGQVYLYIGDKTNSGSPIDKAGLTNGALYGVAVAGVAIEPSATGITSGTAFTLASLGNVEAKTGATLETDSTTAGVTKFNRPEDGAWDPVHPSDFYFVTTNAFTAPSRLWRLHFTDVNNLTAGGTLDMLLDGSEGQKMFDNIAVDKKGHVMLVEDVGNQAHIGKVWRYDVASDALTLIAQHNLDLFTPGAPAFLTQDEEASGIIDASDLLGSGWFLVDVQAHYGISGELVEGGQLLAIFDPSAK